MASSKSRQSAVRQAVKPPKAAAKRAVALQRGKFPIVGVGASAGGLDAFRKFLVALPADTGMAFVLIQHLDPMHESMMVELLVSHTQMTVVQSTDGMLVKPNHVYLMPPRAYLAVRDGALHLSPPRSRHGTRLPFDFFLNSLALACGKEAICAVLSGTGADGSEGIKAIKLQGGLVIAQDPEEAAYDGMPRSAIKTGVVDLILSLAEIPVALKLPRPLSRSAQRKLPVPAEFAPELLEQVVALLRVHSPQNFNLYKTGTLLRRLARRMAMNGITDSRRYLALLRKDKNELKLLAKDLLIHVTSFFRDPKAFALLETQVIPDLIGDVTPNLPLRMWVPGCSTGEEPYSIAMILLEAAANSKMSRKVLVFASDVDEEAVSFARNGLYPESIAADMNPTRLARFFTREAEGYRVTPELREAVMFTIHDLLADPPFSRLDLISCRNLLIYLRPDIQQQTLALFHFGLRTGGVLFLGISETAGGLVHRFEPIIGDMPFFRRVGTSQPKEVQFPTIVDRELRPPGLPVSRSLARSAGFGDMTQQRLLETYAPASVLINHGHECLFHFGAVDRYLRVAAGDANRDLLAKARDGLGSKLRAAITQVRRTGERIVASGAKMRLGGDRIAVDIAVEPVLSGEESLLLVSFIDRPKPDRPVSKKPAVNADVTLMRQLEEELDATRLELQTAFHELDLANEEYQAISEEASSVNEEYQATNEELETSKEELQSLNQELITLNAALQETVAQQRAMASDMQNILDSSDTATLFLDKKLHIRFFTPATRSVLHVIASDVGRPLADLALQAEDVDLPDEAKRVLSTGLPLSSEVRGKGGIWYVRRILPYRTLDGLIGGVVVTFNDISLMKAAWQEVETARAYSDSIIDTVSQPLIVLDDALCLVSANRSFCRDFDIDPDSDVGRTFTSLFDPSTVASFVERIENELGTIDDHEVKLDGSGTGGRTLLLSARQLRERPTDKRRILVAINDATERKRADEAIALAKSQAERANRGKSRFLAAASHDLRQPLQTLSLLQGILVKRIKDPSTLRLIDRIDQTLRVMSGMMDTLLDINQLEAGIVRPEVADFPIASLFDRIQADFADHAKSKKLGWRMVPSGLFVQSDPRLLEQMLRNLLSNAVKYTKQGKILLGCRRRGETLRIEVWDTGIGIPENQLQMVFEEFHQLDNPARDRELGLGLGLSIVQHLANLLGHNISVHSALDSGSVFSIDVPLGQMTPNALSGNAQKAPTQIEPKFGEILIIEDDPAVREMLELLFSEEGHSTVAASDGDEVFALAARGTLRPDLVVADYNLPMGRTGLQVSAALRATLHEAIPVVILTGDISSDTLSEIARQGCNYVHKPVKATDLLQLIQNLLMRSQSKVVVEKRVRAASVSIAKSHLPTVFVVDDDTAVREAIGEWLREHGHVMQLCASGEAFLASYQPDQTGCLVVDARLPGMDGLTLVRQLKKDGIQLPAIMITGYGDIPMAVAAMKAGAVDFLEKPVRHSELLTSIDRALVRGSSSNDSAPNAEAIARIAALTIRQRQVMDHIAAGHANKEIAARLGISQRTVENHRSVVMDRTGSKTLPDLIRLIMRAG